MRHILRHCERSEAIQKCVCGRILDCFAALAMTSGEAPSRPIVVLDKRAERALIQDPLPQGVV